MHETANEILSAIRQRFTTVARFPSAKQQFAIGPVSAKSLGYDVAEIDALPYSLTESFAGVGNPLALGQFHAGQVALDVGCGAGMDSVLVARRVGPSGRVISVDITDEMIKKAKANAALAGVSNVEFHCVQADALPVGANTVDVVISNGVFNLCLDKPKVLAEMFRVLKPGGRVQMADVLLEECVTQEEVAQKGTWSN